MHNQKFKSFKSTVVLSLLCTTPVLASHTSGLGFMGGKQFASPMNTESAITAPKGNLNVGTRFEYRHFQSLSGAKREQLKTANTSADLHSATTSQVPIDYHSQASLMCLINPPLMGFLN